MVWLIIVELKLNYKIIVHLMWKKSTRMEWRIKWNNNKTILMVTHINKFKNKKNLTSVTTVSFYDVR